MLRDWWGRLTSGVKSVIAVIVALGLFIAVPVALVFTAVVIGLILAYMVFEAIREDQKDE